MFIGWTVTKCFCWIIIVWFSVNREIHNSCFTISAWMRAVSGLFCYEEIIDQYSLHSWFSSTVIWIICLFVLPIARPFLVIYVNNINKMNYVSIFHQLLNPLVLNILVALFARSDYEWVHVSELILLYHTEGREFSMRFLCRINSRNWISATSRIFLKVLPWYFNLSGGN